MIGILYAGLKYRTGTPSIDPAFRAPDPDEIVHTLMVASPVKKSLSNSCRNMSQELRDAGGYFPIGL
jgi:hypothetical protein